MMLADPFTARELEEESTVEAAMSAEIDVLDDGRLAQPGLAQAAGEPLVLAAGRLPIDEQPEPILATEFAGMAVRPSARRRSTVGWISICVSLGQW
jgi:hypothetical protein